MFFASLYAHGHLFHRVSKIIFNTWAVLNIFSCPEQLNRWPCHWLNFFLQFWHFLTTLTTFDNFWEFWQFLRVLTIFESFDNFWQFFDIFWQFLTILTIFWSFLQFSTMSTFEILITILTIENLNDNLCYLTINCDTGQHFQFLRCFHISMLYFTLRWVIRCG